MTFGPGYDRQNPPPDDGGGQPADDAVGPDGGELTFASGAVAFDFPAGAVAAETTITAEPTADYPADNGVIASTVYEFGPDGATFDAPVQVTLEYTDAGIPVGVVETSLVIATVVGNAWQTVAGSVVDTANNTVTAPVMHFSKFGIRGEAGGGGTGDNPGAGAIVWNEITYDQNAWIVDEPSIANEFAELPDAIAYMENLLDPEQTGLAVIATSRALEVETLDFSSDITIGYVEGVSPRLKGKNGSVTVNATGAIGFSGLVVEGETEINANRSAYIDGNTFTGPLTVNFGATSGASSLPSSVGNNRHPSDAASAGGSVSGNTVAGPFEINYKGNFNASGQYDLSLNTADSLSIDGMAQGGIGGTVEINATANIVDKATLRLKLSDSAQANLSDHQSLSLMHGDLEFGSGSATAAIRNNTTAKAELEAWGLTGFVEATNVTATQADYSFQANDLKYSGTNNVYTNFGVKFNGKDGNTPGLEFNENGIGVSEEMTLKADDAPLTAKLKLGLAGGSVDGNFTASAKGEVKYNFSNNVTFGADVKLDIIGDASPTDISFDSAKAVGNVQVDVFDGPNQAFHAFTAAGTDFQGGVNFIIGIRGTFGLHPPSSNLFVGPRLVSQNSGEIHIDNCTISSPYTLAGVQVENVEIPVTIENCDISTQYYSVRILETDAPVTIRNCRLTGEVEIDGDTGDLPRTGMVDSACLIEGNTIKPGAMWPINTIRVQELRNCSITGNTFDNLGTGARIELSSGKTILDNNTILGDTLIWQWDGIGPAVAYVTGNQITGKVGVGDGAFGTGAYAKVTGNSFTNGRLEDWNPTGGLLADPIDQGLDPTQDISCPIDFDGNGCQDYPKGFPDPSSDANYKDSEGRCNVDGIDLPSEPGV